VLLLHHGPHVKKVGGPSGFAPEPLVPKNEVTLYITIREFRKKSVNECCLFVYGLNRL
jgi:hypothetical protein